jgi:hypothetical protein
VAAGRPGVTNRKPVLVATVTARAAGCGMPAAGRPAVMRGLVAELQLTLGEGPSHDVLEFAAPVLAADLGDENCGRR